MKNFLKAKVILSDSLYLLCYREDFEIIRLCIEKTLKSVIYRLGTETDMPQSKNSSINISN